MASGNLGHVTFPHEPGRVTLERLQELHPGLLDGLPDQRLREPERQGVEQQSVVDQSVGDGLGIPQPHFGVGQHGREAVEHHLVLVRDLGAGDGAHEGGEQGGAQYMDGSERFSVRSRTP